MTAQQTNSQQQQGLESCVVQYGREMPKKMPLNANSEALGSKGLLESLATESKPMTKEF